MGNIPPIPRNSQEIHGQGSSPRVPWTPLLQSMIGDLPIAPDGLSAISGTLIRHFQTHTCHLMMPTLAPSQNPWLAFYLPTALKEPATPSTKCLLHALIAVAAFNKAELSVGEKAVFRFRGLEYKAIAETLLRCIVEGLGSNTPTMNDTMDKQSLLAAALTMTSIEIGCSISGLIHLFNYMTG
jgi:hypothetical protein